MGITPPSLQVWVAGPRALQVQGRGSYHYRCREEEPLCQVEFYNGGGGWVPYEYCVEAHGANGPTVQREDFDEHGERVDNYE